MTRIAFIDLDGTVFEPGTKTPLPGALERLKQLRAEGWGIVYFTCRPLPTPRGCPDAGWDQLLIDEGLGGAYMHKPFADEYAVFDDKFDFVLSANAL